MLARVFKVGERYGKVVCCVGLIYILATSFRWYRVYDLSIRFDTVCPVADLVKGSLILLQKFFWGLPLAEKTVHVESVTNVTVGMTSRQR